MGIIKRLAIVIGLLAAMLSLAFTHSLGVRNPFFVAGLIRATASGATPDTVIMLGRLEDSTSGTTVTSTIADNGFVGDSDGTWSIGAPSGTTYPQVQTTQTIFEDGVQISGGTGLGDSGNTRYYFFRHTGNDRYPQYTFTSAKSTPIVFGFNMRASNWNGSTSGSFNIYRIDADPFLIVNLGDHSEGAFVSLQVHTGLGIGTAIPITNDIPYRVVGKWESGVDAEIKVYTVDGAGVYTLVGTSTLALDGTGTADYIRFTNEDDHAETTGDDLRTDNYTVSYTGADYPNVHLPNY